MFHYLTLYCGHGSAGDFLRDLQAEFQNWEAGLNSEQKPKSLWEELAVSSLPVFSTVLL
jgi:hypothetical protein